MLELTAQVLIKSIALKLMQ